MTTIQITDYFILGRWLSLTGFTITSLAIIVWMFQNKARALFGLSLLLCSSHAMIYYGVYLLYWYHPDLIFDLQSFANWGSVVFGQIAWTGAFIGWDMVTGWFSRYVIKWFLHNPLVKNLVWILR